MFSLISDLFRTPSFQAGARVNRFQGGQIDRLDGYVLAQQDKDVLVEWPRHGTDWERAHQLCEQH